MAIDHILSHSPSEFNLPEKFANESFKELSEFADANALNLITAWFNKEKHKDVEIALKLASSMLHFFEVSISDDPKSLSIFKLGEFYGHVNCLNHISGNEQQHNSARKCLKEIKALYPEYANFFERIILILYQEGNKTHKQLVRKLSLKLQDLVEILYIMKINLIIDCYPDTRISLTGIGCLLGSQLTEKAT